MNCKCIRLLLICGCFALASCGQRASHKTNFEKAVASIDEFDWHLTKGFEYQARQCVGSTLANVKGVSLWVSFDDGVKAMKSTGAVRANKFQGEPYDCHFSENPSLTYFRNNQICEMNGNFRWEWRPYEESEYFKINLSIFAVKEKRLLNVVETAVDADLKFTADVPFDYAKKIFGEKAAGIKELKYTLVVANDFSILKFVSFSFSQEITNTVISFEPRFELADYEEIILPE